MTKPSKPVEKPKFTPTWMTIKQAALGWGVSERQARRIVRTAEAGRERGMLERGRLRVADFLAIPRGDNAAAPMIPDVDRLWAILEAYAERNDRLMQLMAKQQKTLDALCKALGFDAKSGQIRTSKPGL